MKKDPGNIDERKLVLYLLDEISEAGSFEVEVWLDKSQENRDKYESLKKTWVETGKIGYFPGKIDVDKVWNQFSNKFDIQEDPEANSSKSSSSKPQSNTRSLKFFYAAAAVLFLAWASVTMLRFIQNDGFKGGTQLASLEQVLQDTLSDGSAIQLNENTTLRVSRQFDKKERLVELDGEAFFEVKPDTARPFIVETNLGKVKVLGTLFQVKGRPESDLEVFVEEGKVELTGLNNEGEDLRLVLEAGERGIISYPDGKLMQAESINPDDLFWANKKLIFEETRLSLVFDILRKHYKSEIEVENEKVLQCMLSATFNNETIDQILEVIAVSFDLIIEKEEEKFIIKGEGCANE